VSTACVVDSGHSSCSQPEGIPQGILLSKITSGGSHACGIVAADSTGTAGSVWEGTYEASTAVCWGKNE
jgi:hypothetical protein